MKIYKVIEKLLMKIIEKIWILFIRIHENKNIRKKRNLYKNVTLTKEQKNMIDKFYKENYGKKISYNWHRLYQSYTGNFDFQYIPEYIYTLQLEPKTNKRIEVLPFENKNMLKTFFGEFVKTPKIYLVKEKGRFFDENGNILKYQDAINHVVENVFVKKECIIKESKDTSSGRGVRKIEVHNLSLDEIKKEIEELIKNTKVDFNIQECLKPCNELKQLYPNSINTLRVVTYLTNNGVCVAPIILRIGRGKSYVDNAHAGGMFVGVNNDGELLEKAFTEMKDEYLCHPDTNIEFKGYKIPKIKEIIEVAKNMHKRFPNLGFISWDFTINQDNDIVLIEANLHSQAVWVSQMAHGKAFFGDNTAEILKSIAIRR